MLYMLLSGFQMIIGLHVAYRQIVLQRDEAFEISRMLILGAFILPVLAAAPILAGFYAVNGVHTIEELERLSVASQWLGGGACLLLAGGHFLIARRVPKKFWHTGAALAALVSLGIYVDSLQFLADKNTGVISTFVLDEGASNDVQCEHGQLLIHYNKGGKTDWRCPKTIILMGGSSRPFIPWPDYRHGSSRYLTEMLDTLMEGTKSVKGADQQH